MDTPPAKPRGLTRGCLRDLVIALSLVSTFFFPLNMGMRSAGFVLLGIGCALHLLVKGQLVRDVVLCTEGAYAVARHPYYLANYLIDTSFCLLGGNVFLVLAYPFLFHWAYGRALQEEEATLEAAHGDRFDAYRRAVPQIFPDATSFRRLRTLFQGFSRHRVTTRQYKRLFRFGFVGTLLALAHVARVEGPDAFAPWQGGNTSEGVFLGVLCGLFLLATVLTRCPTPNNPLVAKDGSEGEPVSG